MTEIFKVKNGLSPELINVFELIEKPYSLRTTSHFRSREIRATKYGIETPYLGPKLWKLVPNEYKTIESLEDSKTKIKTWIPENCPCRLCPCRLCKTYIHQVGFIYFPRWKPLTVIAKRFILDAAAVQDPPLEI